MRSCTRYVGPVAHLSNLLGLEPDPGWLETSVFGRSCGGQSQVERRAALKAYTEQPIRQGVLENPWEGSIAGVVLGDMTYTRRLLSGRKVNEEGSGNAGAVDSPRASRPLVRSQIAPSSR